MRQTEAIRVTGVSVCVSVKEAVLIQTSDIQGLLPLWYIRRLFFRRNHVTMRKIRRKLSCRQQYLRGCFGGSFQTNYRDK